MYKVIDGNKACSSIAYMFSEICSIYPITPSSPMASNIDLLSSKDEKNIFNNKVKVVEMQSEAGAIATMHGALISGSLSSTFTSSQGLLLMIPNMYKIAGEMLPGVIHCAARTVATHALSIFGDHSDVYATRSTGFCMLSSSSVKDAYYLACVAHLSSISGSLPFLHFFDGFRTSHEINKINVLDEVDILKLVNFDKINEFRNKSLIGNSLIQKGMAENEDIYFQSVEARNSDYFNMPNIVNDYMKKINEIAKTDYKPFNYYGDEYANNVIVAMGSVCDTIKLVVDKLNMLGNKVGLIEVHLYRPFSKKYLLSVLPITTKNIAVLDKTKESGSIGEPLYLDIVSALKDKNINIVGGRYGLSSKDTNPDDINAVFNMLNTELKNNFTIGIVDDVTNLSLEKKSIDIDLNASELLIYGFGSDGMVSASKEILNLVGIEKYVQGYFEYDSKKSGGVTKSHIRIGDKQINAPYYVTNPGIIMITKDSYVYKYKLIDSIKQNGIVILNTNKTSNELDNYLPNEFKKVLVDKNCRLFIIDANKIASECGIGNKISKIMESVLLKLLNINNYEELMITRIKETFSTKGTDVVNGNIKSIKLAIDSLEEVSNDFVVGDINTKALDVISKINSREGDSLKVSGLIPYKTGSFGCGFTKKEKRNVCDVVAKWDKDKCINCNLCSLMCPHAVIRPKEDGYIAISERDCTGCTVCVSVCPKEALSMGKFDESLANYNEAIINIDNTKVDNPFNIKNSQFNKPLFEFSGACAGCGETSYIKMLTQLFGEKLIIANATGCSSIYGGSVPSTPYSIPWANSLFEDNAEFALGMFESITKKREEVKRVIEDSIHSVSDSVKKDYELWLNNMDDYVITREVKESLKNKLIPNDLKTLINYIPSKSVWAIGGDGWAYDIGFGGLDHVLSSNNNINILVLDTEVYSNTGGQMSKSSRLGQVAEFANMGKTTVKKDLFKIASNYPNVYVATVSIGANPMHTIKAFAEAEKHEGPSLIIAYSPCVEHGIKKGLSNSVNEQKLGVKCGYTLLLRHVPEDNKTYLDSSEPDFSKYEEFLLNETRYSALKIKDPFLASNLLEENKNNAIKRYEYYKNL